MALANHSLYTGEARIIGLRLTRQVGEEVTQIAPDSATITVTKGEETIIDGASATISGTLIYYLISSNDVTASAGTYSVVWAVTEGTEIIKKTQTITVSAP